MRLRNRPATLGSARVLRPSSERRFAQRARRRRLLSLRPVLVAAAFVAMAALAAWVVLGSSLLAVKRATVTGEHRLSAAQVTSAAQVPYGRPLARVDLSAIRSKVEALPQVRSATVERAWPSTVRIAVVERTPAAVVKRPGKPLALVDSTGVVFADVSVPPAGLSVLTLTNPGPGDPATRAALDVAAALPTSVRDTVSSITVPSPAAVTLTLTSGVTVIWGDGSSSARKAQVLAALLHEQAHPPVSKDKHGNPLPAPCKAKTFDVSAPDVATTRC